MKKILITTALLGSISILSACSMFPSSQNDTGTGSNNEMMQVEPTGTGILDGLTWGKSVEIKELIETRKVELSNETWTKKELTEKDIELLETITDKLSEKK